MGPQGVWVLVGTPGVLVVVAVGLLVEVFVMVAVGVLVAVACPVGLGVNVAVTVDVLVGVPVGVLVAVLVGVPVGVAVKARVFVGTGVEVAGKVGVATLRHPSPIVQMVKTEKTKKEAVAIQRFIISSQDKVVCFINEIQRQLYRCSFKGIKMIFLF